MGTHILLAGPSREVQGKANRLGARLSLLTPVHKLKGRRNLEIYERILALPADATVQEWVELARHIHKLHPIAAVGGFSEESQDLAASMAEALSLPFHSAEVIRLTRHKAEMRRALAAAGLDDTPACLVESAEQVGRFGEEFGYPFVLKPVDGRGSLGIAIVRAEHDIKKAIENYGAHASKHRMLAEAFLEGEEYSIEAFSEKGTHRVVCVTQKFKDPVTCIETGHCVPAPIDEAVRERLVKFVISALDAIGLKDGPSHTEVIDTPRGPKMVETHARLAGDSIVELIWLTSGVDLDELWVRQVCGESVLGQVPQHQTCFASVSFATPQARGTLERIDGLDEARALPGVRTVESLQDPGAELEGAYDSFSRGAFAIATGNTAREATGRARAATAKLRFLISCSDSGSSVGKPERQ